MDRLLKYFEPEKYTLDLKIDKNKKTIGGVVTIVGEAKADKVKFHAVRLNINDVKIDGSAVKFTTINDELEIATKKGKQEIVINYDGKLNENMQGAYLSTYQFKGKTETIVATQFESHYAREAFPCIDEPAAKAIFELTIAVPEGSDDIVLSNMPAKDEFRNAPSEGLKDDTTLHKPEANAWLGAFRSAAARGLAREPRGDGRERRGAKPSISSGFRIISFEPTPRMSTYLLAWVIGRFHGKTVTNDHGVEITTYCSLAQDLDSVDFANEIAAKSLEFYDDNFKEPYPLKKLTQVALPDFEAGAMENWGLVTYRESMMLISKDATLGAKKGVALTVAHELSHQWFGDLVTMQWWDDLWLNESFASVMEYYAVDYIHPEYKIFEGFFTGDACAALNRDAYTGVQAVHQDVKDPAEIATLFDAAIVYAKGARLMLMLIRLMGWKQFCKGLVDYFNKFKYQNTVGDDLWACLKPYAGFDPSKLMHAFIDRPGYPVITNEGDNFKKFSQKRFLLDGGKMLESDWPLPEITEDMSGHYVLNLTEDEFEVRLKNFDNLGLEEKLRLLIDRDLITKSGLQCADSLVPLAMRFKDESAPAVWNKIASLVSNLKIYFDDESEEEKLLKEYVLELVDGKLKEIGLTTRENDDEDMIRLRANLMGLDYYAEDEARFKELAKLYNEDYSKMDKEIRDDILSAKVYLEPMVVGGYLEKYKVIADPDVKFDYLAAACLVRDEKQLDKLVALLGDFDTVKSQDQLYLFIYLYRNPKSRVRAFNYVTKNWESIRKTGGDKTLSDYPMLIARLSRTEEELKKYVDFFGPMREDPALSRAIEIGENEIKARVKLISKYHDLVLEALKNR